MPTSYHPIVNRLDDLLRQLDGLAETLENGHSKEHVDADIALVRLSAQQVSDLTDMLCHDLAVADRHRIGVEKIRRAIHDPGRSPATHLATMSRHRSEWPTLHKAIDEMLGVDR